MQTQSVISINLWSVLISLANLLLLTLILKKFLFKPVMKVLDDRKASIDADYAKAKEAREDAEEQRKNYAAAMAAAKQTADQMIAEAALTAGRRGAEIENAARADAAQIRSQAEEDARLERKRAEQDIRREIADVSAKLTEKLLEREISPEDHQGLIDDFLRDMGTDK